MGKRRAKAGKRLPRILTVAMDMGKPVAPDALYFDRRTGRVILLKNGVPLDPVSARVEIGYERKESPEKGNKVLARAPLSSNQLWASPSRALEGFDHLCAIDTNTKVVNGEYISVTCAVHGESTHIIIPGKTLIQYGTSFCLEFRGIQEKAENIALLELIEAIRRSPTYKAFWQIALIVDSDLDRLEMYNTREAPIYGNFYLPQNMKLIYASSEVRETTANEMLALAEKEAKTLLNYIIDTRCDQGLIAVSNGPFTHYKQWDYAMLPRR